MDEDRKRPKDERIAWMKPKDYVEYEVSEIEKPLSKNKKKKSKKKAIKKSSKANDFDDDSDVFDAIEEDDNDFHDDEKNDGDFSGNELDDEDEEELEDLHEEKPINPFLHLGHILFSKILAISHNTANILSSDLTEVLNKIHSNHAQ